MKSRTLLFLTLFFFTTKMSFGQFGWGVPACDPPSTFMYSWLNESDASLGLTTFSGTTLIEGTFTVTGTFTFDAAQVGMDAGATILVDPGATLTITNGTLVTAGKLSMWNSIEVAPGAQLFISNGSTICGAEKAITANSLLSASSANYSVTNSSLIANRIGLYVSNFLNPHPGIFTGNLVQGNLLPDGSNSETGAMLFNVGDGLDGVVIGNASSPPNTFTMLAYGIQGQDVSLVARNSVFSTIQPLASVGGGFGITANSPSVQRIVIGGGVLTSNTFRDCLFGVFTNNYDQVDISDNILTATALGLFESGISVNRSTTGVATIDNNIDMFTDIAMKFDNNSPSHLIVEDNTIVGTFNDTRGILIDENVGQLSVFLNDVSDVWRGIGMQSVDIASTAGVIRDNLVSISYPGSGDAAIGIYSIESNDLAIDDNEISGNCTLPCTTSTAFNRNVRGILQWSSQSNVVSKNEITECGAGIYVRGNSTNSTAVCNDLVTCYSGFVMDNVAPNEYGTFIGGTTYVTGGGTAGPSDNQWSNPITGIAPVRILLNNSDLMSTIWNYRNLTPEYDYALVPPVLIGPSSAPTGNLTNLGMPCTPPYPEPRLGDFDAATMQHILDSLYLLNDGSAIPLTVYEFLVFASKEGSTDPSTNGLIALTNITALEGVESALAENDPVSALGNLGSIAPVNTLEVHLVIVLSIKATAMVAQGNDTEPLTLLEYVSPADRAYLESLVFTLPLEETLGASILAQSMLGYTIIPDGWTDGFVKVASSEVNPSEVLIIYPNPSQGTQVVVLLPELTNVLEVFNNVGELVKSYPAENLTGGTLQIDADKLAPGMYQIVARAASGAIISQGKLTRVQ
jgi:parallel beta-helix repeat protein